MLSTSAAARFRSPDALWRVYGCEAMGSLAATLMASGIFFFTRTVFAWSITRNLLLAAGLGLTYAAGALASRHIAARLGLKRGLIFIAIGVISVSGLAVLRPSPGVVTVAVLVYSAINAASWPMLETFVCAGANAQTLSRRVSFYNLTWSGTAGLSLATAGWLIDEWPRGLFLAALIWHAIGLMLILSYHPPQRLEEAAHVEPEARLRRLRTVAMRLSRICLPATYVVGYSLAAMLPSLPVIRAIHGNGEQTLASSVWLAARFFAFVLLGASHWWHTRPTFLLAAAGVMLLAFLGVTVPISSFLPAWPSQADLPAMILFQIGLGLALGAIYCGSLYFGMVLSQGSTAHGGYHEALIGLGGAIGPGIAALCQWLDPNHGDWGVVTVTGIVALSIIAAVAFGGRADAATSDPLP